MGVEFMIGIDKKVPMIYDKNFDKSTKSIILYFKNKWIQDMSQRLSSGYEEMSQINLALAEMGLEQDINDLREYESRLLGCDQL